MKTPYENRGAEVAEGRTVSAATPAAAAQAGVPAQPPAGLSQIEALEKELRGVNEALDYALLCAKAAAFWVEIGKLDVAARVLDNGLAWLRYAKYHMNNILGGESA
jgi:hypothetical protein